MELFVLISLVVAFLFFVIRSFGNDRKNKQDVALDRFVSQQNHLRSPRHGYEKERHTASASQETNIEPIFRNRTPEHLNEYCEVETPYQNFFLELPYKNLSRSEELIVSKCQPLIKMAQDYDLDVEFSGHNELKIGHFLRWENFSDKGAIVFSEFRLSVGLGSEIGDYSGNQTRFDVFAEVRVETFDGETLQLYCRTSDEKLLRSITSAKKCTRDYLAALEAAAKRSDLLIPVTRHSDLPDITGINERDTFTVVRTRHDGELETLDLCDLKVGVFSLTKVLNGPKLRDSGIKWIAAYSKQKCGLVDIKLSSIKSISPDIRDNLKSTEKAHFGAFSSY